MSEAVPLKDLRSKRVLITGASTGIGAAAAKAFAAHGAEVVLHYNHSDTEVRRLLDAIKQGGGKAHTVQADLTQRGAASLTVETAIGLLGGLDVLINNAGSLCGRTPFMELDDALYEKVMDLNVRSVIAASQAAVPALQQSGEGTIINLGSIAAIDGGGPGSGHYACAKAYIHNLTRHMARDLAARRIRVNAIAPGVIATSFHAETPPERMEAMKKSIHLGRVGAPEDCVGPLLFLASHAMSGYMTGQILHVNGGQFMP